MPKSLLEQLPEIVATGRKTSERILESIESRRRVTPQTRAVVLPARDAAAQAWITQQAHAAQHEVFAPGQTSLLPTPQATLSDASTARPESVDGLPWANHLALIEYCVVDPDYDGRAFRSVLQDYRGNIANDADALRVVTQAVVTQPAQPGPRRVCVRVVDVFGFEAEVATTVEAVS
jgi:hypothetical protein